jgi:hypothetical protein
MSRSTEKLEQNSSRHTAVLFKTADSPNLPEVSGTSFPLLTTVLAGFAVTIAVQLIIRPDADAEISGRVITAIVIFLASTLAFISSIAFAVNAQAHNYLPFIQIDESTQRLIGVPDYARWLGWLQRGWDSFHLAAMITFYGGILLLLAGVNLIVWEFVGPGVAVIVLLLILSNIAANAGVSAFIERRKAYSTPLKNQTDTRSSADTIEKEPADSRTASTTSASKGDTLEPKHFGDQSRESS